MAPFTTEIEFDELNKISLTRVGGRLANESLADLYDACQRHSSETNASVSVVALSSVSECALSYQFIQRLAEQKPATVDGRHRCFIVAPAGQIYGLCRMFQLLAEMTRPLREVVHALGEAFAAIAIQAAQFESTSAVRHSKIYPRSPSACKTAEPLSIGPRLNLATPAAASPES